MRKQTRGERNIGWIETFCRVPNGPQRGLKVVLSQAQREIVRELYDGGGAVEPVSGALGSYIVLLHTCGPEAVEHGSSLPQVIADLFSVWGSSSEGLRDVLKREGEVITCPELGTSYPPRAA